MSYPSHLHPRTWYDVSTYRRGAALLKTNGNQLRGNAIAAISVRKRNDRSLRYSPDPFPEFDNCYSANYHSYLRQSSK